MSATTRLARQLAEADRRIGALERSRSLSRSALVDSTIPVIETDPVTGEEIVVGEIGAPLVRDVEDTKGDVAEAARRPAAVGAPSLVTYPYTDSDGANRGGVDVAWSAVTSGADGKPITVDAYEVAMQRGATGPWVMVASTTTLSVELRPLEPGTDLGVRVRARTRGGVTGDWSAQTRVLVAKDTTPAAVPSLPILTSEMGTVTVRWDGTPTMPADFSHVEASVEAVIAGQPVASSHRLAGPGSVVVAGLDRGSTARARLRSLDRSGNPSAWTAWVTVTAKSVLDGTDFEARVTAAQQEAEQARADAEAAHSLASDASLAASDANNEAVAAYERALAFAMSGSSLIANGDFERGNEGWGTNSAQQAESSPTARSGTQVMRLDVDTANRWPSSNPWVASETGRRYMLTAWFRIASGPATPVGFVLQGQTTAGGTSTLFAPPAMRVTPPTDGTWTRVQVLMQLTTENAVRARFAPWAQASAGTVVHVDDMTVHDVTAAEQARQQADAAARDAADAITKADRAVTGSVTEYAVSTSRTTAPTTGWSTAPTVPPEGQYAWMRTTVTYGSGTTATSAAVLVTGNTGTKGDPGVKGDPGEAGVSVAAITPHFNRLPATSPAPARPTTLNPSGWVTTEPDYLSGHRLYRSERVDYSNDTFAWTDVTRVSSWEIAAQALTSANGRNARITSTSPATGTTNPDTGLPLVKGDTWFQWDTDTARNVIAQWQWDGNGWRREMIASDVIANLDVNKLVVTGSARMTQAVADKIIGDAGYYGSLSTEKMIVAGPGELIVDSAFSNAALTARRVSFAGSRSAYVTAVAAPTAEAGMGAANSLRVDAGRTGAVALEMVGSMTAANGYEAATPVVAGTKVLLSIVIRQENPADRFRWAARLVKADGSTSYAGLTPFEANPGGLVVATRTHEWVVPVDVVKATFVAHVEAGAGRVWVSLPSAQPMTSGRLLVDGAVETRHMLAESIEADRIRSGSWVGRTLRGVSIVGTDNPDNLGAENTTLDQRGVTINRSDGEGGLYPSTELGGVKDRLAMFDENGVSRVDIDGDTGNASFSGGVSIGGGLTIGGRTHEAIHADDPRGIIARYWGSGDSYPQWGNTHYGLVRFSWDALADHLYTVGMKLNIQGTPGDKVQISVRYSTGTNMPTVSSPIVVGGEAGVDIGSGSGIGDWGMTTVNLEVPMGFAPGRVHALVTVRNWTANRPMRLIPAATNPHRQSWWWLRHEGIVGEHGAQSAGSAGGGTPYAGETAPPDAPQPTRRRVEYPVSSWKNFFTSNSSDKLLEHGRLNGGTLRVAQLLFPPVPAGATNVRAYVTLENAYTYNGNGMTAYVGGSTHSTLQGSAPSSVTGNTAVAFTRNQTREIEIVGWTAAHRSVWVGVGAPSGNQYFGRFFPTARIVYTYDL